ncbi:MAG: SWIM zinc finger family protein [Cyanobacteria bacterium P01_A01_bin.84]
MTENTTLQASREWWSQRWLELLDSYRFKKRLERGRNYARQGNILSIEFQGAKVIAKVQGSEAEPYTVSLSLESFSDEEWGFIIETMSGRAIIPAKLLAGEMPQNIEEVFTASGLSLFPFTLSDVRGRCTCPDKANPCKHIAAIYYELGDRFSEDPFVMFQLRGRSKEQIINNLRLFRGGKKAEDITPEDLTQESENLEEIPAQVAEVELTEIELVENQSKPIEIDKYWNYNEPLESSLVVISPPVNETVLDVLGSIPLAKDEEKVANMTSADLVMRYLDSIYKDVSQKAVLAAMSLNQ